MTYSIVARHPDSGELGVAVQSHYFSVGIAVPWARPGVGAVATQAMVNTSFGLRGLELLAAGRSAADAVAELIAADEGREHRQLAIVDAKGDAAAHTGARCIADAGHILGRGVSAQGNIMVTPDIWPAMLAAYEAALGRGAVLAEALIDALDAAEALGGDARGRQSAAILVVPGTGEAWEKVVELRVEDHPEPLIELRRLWQLHRAYRLADDADDRLVAGDPAGAGALFSQALELAPDNHELRFWAGVSIFHSGDRARGMELVRSAIAEQPGWVGVVSRLSDEVVPGASAVAAALAAE